MPSIFFRENKEWCAARIETKPALLRFNPVSLEVLDAAPVRPGRDAVVLMRIGDERKWVAMVPAEIKLSHNGTWVQGMRVLAHADSLAAEAAAPVYFSTEDPARVEEFAGNEQPTICPRCKTPLEDRQLAVKCMRCGIYHHQTAEKPCWLYSTTCSCCEQPTALDTSLRWTPETL